VVSRPVGPVNPDAGPTVVAEYLASLEPRDPDVDLPEASGGAIVKEFCVRRGGEDPQG